jgi:hypothetical protein
MKKADFSRTVVEMRHSNHVPSSDQISLAIVPSLPDGLCRHTAPACWNSSLAATSSEAQRAPLLLMILRISRMIDQIDLHIRRMSSPISETRRASPHRRVRRGEVNVDVAPISRLGGRVAPRVHVIERTTRGCARR